MKEVVTKAWAVKANYTDEYGVVAFDSNGVTCVEYQVWYRTEKSDGTDMENMFEVYHGSPSVRFWNLAQHIAGKLNNGGE